MNSRRDRELSESVVLLEARNKVNTSPYTWSSCSAAASEQCTLNFGGKWGGQKSDRRGNKDGALIKAQRFPKKNVRSVKVGESSSCGERHSKQPLDVLYVVKWQVWKWIVDFLNVTSRESSLISELDGRFLLWAMPKCWPKWMYSTPPRRSGSHWPHANSGLQIFRLKSQFVVTRGPGTKRFLWAMWFALPDTPQSSGSCIPMWGTKNGRVV